MAITKEQIAELESKHGERIAHCKSAEKAKQPEGSMAEASPLWEAVFRKPTRAEWKGYKRQVHNPAEVADAQETLAIKCVIFPPREQFLALLEDWPAIPEVCSKAFDRLLGTEVEAATEKG